MVAKIAIYVCPMPDCPTISSTSDKVCSRHPDLVLQREIYEHRSKIDSRSRNVVSSDFLSDLVHSYFGERK